MFNSLPIIFLFPFHAKKRYGGYVRASASQNQTKKLRKRRKVQKMEESLLQGEQILDETKEVGVEEEDKTSSSSETDEFQPAVVAASRNAVLRACTVTSVSMGALGVLIRQVHFMY